MPFLIKLRHAAAAVAIAVVLTACGVGSPSTVPRPVGDGSLQVMVYNIHAGKDAKGVDNLARVAALVREAGADLVLLQEVDRNTTRSGKVDQPAELAKMTGYSVALGKSLDFQGGDYGIALLSRSPIGAWERVHLPVEPPQERSGGSHEARVALVATVATSAGPVTIVNTHLDASREDTYRRQEVRRIVALVDSLRARGTPVIIGGDFNSTPESAAQEDVRRSGMRDSWTECGRGGALTFPANVPV
ncbi:MAG: endonuclease/exonuclease/phosphatase family protein, partial [Gemmatimonadaceae bacterium]|nr:endonuclease/exonuclease/phosphatase family protein [Gemmatimonadaceae bacterium]